MVAFSIEQFIWVFRISLKRFKIENNQLEQYACKYLLMTRLPPKECLLFFCKTYTCSPTQRMHLFTCLLLSLLVTELCYFHRGKKTFFIHSGKVMSVIKAVKSTWKSASNCLIHQTNPLIHQTTRLIHQKNSPIHQTNPLIHQTNRLIHKNY